MRRELPSTGETQVIATEHHGFVDSCIALIETLLDARSITVIHPDPTSPTGK